MRPLRRKATLTALTIMGLAMACVTVNIYFPAAKVEKTADEIVGEVYKDVKPPADQKKPQGSSSLDSLLAWLAPASAHAADAASVSNATIRTLKDNIKNRITQLAPFLAAGQVGIDNNGFLQVVNTGGMDVRQVAQVRRLVDSDNADRRRLYQEVAGALDQPQNAGKVQNIFAGKWRAEAPGGWLVQDAGGQWKKK